jgi:hypothetical protein
VNAHRISMQAKHKQRERIKNRASNNIFLGTCRSTFEGDSGSLKNLTPTHARWCSAANHDMRWAIMPQQVLWRMRYYFKRKKPLVFREGTHGDGARGSKERIPFLLFGVQGAGAAAPLLGLLVVSDVTADGVMGSSSQSSPKRHLARTTTRS